MAFEHEKGIAAHMLEVLEDGTRPVGHVRAAYEEADPALVHLLFAWLRANYPPHHSASDGVLGRIVALCQESPATARKARDGERDALVEVFLDAYDLRSLDRRELVDLVVEKIEG